VEWQVELAPLNVEELAIEVCWAFPERQMLEVDREMEFERFGADFCQGQVNEPEY
jgi:hypothetical protein